MKLTIRTKLTASFLILACLVLLSGGVGIVILGKVSKATDTVVKDKVPVQYCVMKANVAVEKIEKEIAGYIASSAGLEAKEQELMETLDEFDMWISMLELGTGSDDFKASSSGNVFERLGLEIQVPRISDDLLETVQNIKKESAMFRQNSINVIKARKEYLSYSVEDQGKTYDLPTYLLFLQRDHNNWLNALRDAVNIVTPFKYNTDPRKGMLGEWLHEYKVDDAGLSKLIKKMKKYHKKMLKYAVTINEKPDSEWKTKYLSRSAGAAARIEQYFGKMHKYIAPIYKTLEQGQEETIQAVKQTGLNINKGLESLVQGAEKEMVQARENSDSTKKSGTFFLVVILVVALISAAGLGFYMSNSLSSNISALAEVTKKIAQGDLKNKVDVSSEDELGDLAKDTNLMADNLRDIISQITDYSTQLTASSSDLSGLAASMSEGAESMTSKSESVAAAAEEMSANMNSVSQSSEEAATNINTVSVATDEINSSITEIAKNSERGNSITQEAVERANSATEKVNELGTAAQEISKVTEVISDISGQTNLLALNATIEAARAGEAGKGFAVVASEIKQLALQTEEATNDIRHRIESIQNSTTGTVDEIEGVAKIIENVNDIVGTIAAAVEEQSATTREISDNMTQAADGLQEVSGNVAQSTGVANEIARDIVDVNTSSKEVLKNSEVVNNNSTELKTLAGNLQELISHFKF